jgi:hypothetical protein
MTFTIDSFDSMVSVCHALSHDGMIWSASAHAARGARHRLYIFGHICWRFIIKLMANEAEQGSLITDTRCSHCCP